MKNTGWYSDKKVDISHFINTLRENNYIISDSAIKSYSEYYGNYKLYLKAHSKHIYIPKLSIFPIGIVEIDTDYFEHYITEDEKIIDQYETLLCKWQRCLYSLYRQAYNVFGIERIEKKVHTVTSALENLFFVISNKLWFINF